MVRDTAPFFVRNLYLRRIENDAGPFLLDHRQGLLTDLSSVSSKRLIPIVEYPASSGSLSSRFCLRDNRLRSERTTGGYSTEFSGFFATTQDGLICLRDVDLSRPPTIASTAAKKLASGIAYWMQSSMPASETCRCTTGSTPVSISSRRQSWNGRRLSTRRAVDFVVGGVNATDRQFSQPSITGRHAPLREDRIVLEL